MNSEEEQYIKQLESAYEEERSKNLGQSSTAFGGVDTQNLVEWQLDFKKEILDIERLLRKQVIKRKDDGQGGVNEVYEDPKQSEQLFNERGVQAILELLRWYLNKNIILSNYDAEMIAIRVKQFAHALRRLIFLNYKEFGLDTKYKQKHYETIVMKLVDVVEASYNRALAGGERESLRTARMVTQNQPLGQSMQFPQTNFPQQRRKFSMLNPFSWGNR